MEFNDRRTGDDLTRTYKIETRHRGVANRMVLNHLDKQGVGADPSSLGTPMGPQWDSSVAGGGNPIAHWNHETKMGYNHVTVRGSHEQHNAMSQRWAVSDHPTDGYGRGR